MSGNDTKEFAFDVNAFAAGQFMEGLKDAIIREARDEIGADVRQTHYAEGQEYGGRIDVQTTLDEGPVNVAFQVTIRRV